MRRAGGKRCPAAPRANQLTTAFCLFNVQERQMLQPSLLNLPKVNLSAASVNGSMSVAGGFSPDLVNYRCTVPASLKPVIIS